MVAHETKVTYLHMGGDGVVTVVQGYAVRSSKVRPKDMISKGVSFVAFSTPV